MKEHNAIDLTRILKPYRDKWIALSSDEKRVVGSGTTLKEAVVKAHKNGEKDPILTRVPRHYGSYIL